MTRRSPLALFALIALGVGSPLHAQFVSDPEKTDSLRLRNGDWMVGDLRDMARGIVTYKTDAMSTIRVKWSRVLTAITEKRFQIYLEDERRYFGSLQASETLGRVVIRADRDTLEVAMESVVELKLLKATLWSRLDGSIDFGFNFTQQNKKVDLLLRSDTWYLFNRNRFNLLLDGTFTGQETVADITRGTAQITYIREAMGMWFVGFAVSAEQNSQLSLDVRGAVAGGPGRFFIANSGMELGSALMIGYNREKFTGEEANNAVPLGLLTDLQLFNWTGMSTDLSSRLVIAPVLNNQGRWRISFNANLSQEVVSDLYLRIGVVEEFDSKPPSVDANKNDLHITTSLGWTY